MADDDPYAAAIVAGPAAAQTTPTPPSDPYAAAVKTAAVAPSDPYAAALKGDAATPAPLNGFGSGGFGSQSFLNGGGTALKNLGRTLVAGHKDPIGAFLGKLQGGQRMLQTIGSQAFGDDDPTLDPLHSLMDPSTAPAMQAKSDAWMGLGPGGAISSALGSGNGNLGQKMLLGGAHAIADAVTNPISYINPAGIVGAAGKVGGTVLHAIPGVGPVADAAGAALGSAGSAIANSAPGQAVSKLFNPSEYLKGLTPEGMAQYEQITNTAFEHVRSQKAAEDAIVAKPANVAAIRAGVMPDEVASLFRPKGGVSNADAWKQFFPDGLQVGTRPQDVQMQLFNNRAPNFKALAMPELQKAGFFTSPSGVLAGRSMGKPDLFSIPSDNLGAIPSKTGPVNPLTDVQNRLEAKLEQPDSPNNILQQVAQKATKLGNQAFLANPVPHTFNLMDLAYNKYGLPTVAKGLGNMAQIATGNVGGDLASKIGQLAATGTNSQYGNIFDELGLTGLKNSSGTGPLSSAYNATVAPASRVMAKAVNVPLIGAQRASNAAQNTILNPMETGLRAASLDAEKAAGTDTAQAMRNIHSTFGTGAPNAVTQGLQKFAVPFAGFHFQTAPGSVAQAAFHNPGRIVNTVQTERDMNNATGANYRSTIPGANAARMIADPLTYFGSPGGLLGLEGPYSMLSQSKAGAVGKAATSAAAKFTPGSQPGFDAAKVAGSVANQALHGGPPVDYRPLFNAAFGGYTAKK